MNSALDKRARQHWHELTEEQKRQAVRDMDRMDLGHYTIASATGLSIEVVREILAERE